LFFDEIENFWLGKRRLIGCRSRILVNTEVWFVGGFIWDPQRSYENYARKKLEYLSRNSPYSFEVFKEGLSEPVLVASTGGRSSLKDTVRKAGLSYFSESDPEGKFLTVGFPSKKLADFTQHYGRRSRGREIAR